MLMRHLIILYSLFALTSLFHSPSLAVGPQGGQSVTSVPLKQIVKRPGTYKALGGKCSVSLEISGMGGDLTLIVDAPRVQGIRDITGIAWATQNLLVFTVSPIYGKPGVYLYHCTSKETKRIVSPKTIDKAYPDGADYFELQGIEERGGTVRFYYGQHVDSIDFSSFRTKDYLFQCQLDGTQFQKARN